MGVRCGLVIGCRGADTAGSEETILSENFKATCLGQSCTLQLYFHETTFDSEAFKAQKFMEIKIFTVFPSVNCTLGLFVYSRKAPYCV